MLCNIAKGKLNCVINYAEHSSRSKFSTLTQFAFLFLSCVIAFHTLLPICICTSYWVYANFLSESRTPIINVNLNLVGKRPLSHTKCDQGSITFEVTYSINRKKWLVCFFSVNQQRQLDFDIFPLVQWIEVENGSNGIFKTRILFSRWTHAEAF